MTPYDMLKKLPGVTDDNVGAILRNVKTLQARRVCSHASVTLSVAQKECPQLFAPLYSFFVYQELTRQPLDTLGLW